MKRLTPIGLAILGAGAVVGARRIQRRQRLRQKTALITGSSRGLGFMLAREYARAGCRVVICARDEEELGRARDRLREEGAQVLAIPCDVSDEAQVQALIQEVEAEFGDIHILVNNAGIIQVGALENQRAQDFRDAMDVMFYGTLYTTLAVLPQMLERKGGRIVNITSIGAKVSVPHLLPYGAAKFAALGFSQGLRAELSRHGISVTTIVPGLLRVGSFKNALFKGQRDREFAWFSLASSLPVLTTDVERAAREIFRASERGEAEHIIGALYKFVAPLAGAFPGLTARVMGAVNRLLPEPTLMGGEVQRGSEVEGELRGSMARMVEVGTWLGQQAAGRTNQ